MTVAKVLVEQVFNRCGLPLQLLSDLGDEVDSFIMRGMLTHRHRQTANNSIEAIHYAAVERFH